MFDAQGSRQDFPHYFTPAFAQGSIAVKSEKSNKSEKSEKTNNSRKSEKSDKAGNITEKGDNYMFRERTETSRSPLRPSSMMKPPPAVFSPIGEYYIEEDPPAEYPWMQPPDIFINDIMEPPRSHITMSTHIQWRQTPNHHLCQHFMYQD